MTLHESIKAAWATLKENADDDDHEARAIAAMIVIILWYALIIGIMIAITVNWWFIGIICWARAIWWLLKIALKKDDREPQ